MIIDERGMTMGENVEFQAEDVTTAGYLALPEGGTGPGVLVLHAWWGLNPIFTDLCERLAREGFVAFAPDLNAGQIATTIDEAKALMKARDNARTEAAALGGLEYLRQHPARTGTGLGAIGFSMGAAWALELSAARADALVAAVLFYGAGEADFGSASATYLGHFAENDEWEEMEYVRAMEDAMQSAGREMTLHIYPGTQHWFFEQNRPEYDPAAATLAWQRTLEFLRQQLAR
jgi:carboxymethylenebutenolidase